ncbi:MAG: response regulator [Cyanobacteria bacterium SZAS-4]|nr:response regulator [Cyanobacteria bacterium SZAS-4]
MEHNPSRFLEEQVDGKALVLIVDDDPSHCKMMELMARKLGLKTHSVPSCGEALDALNMFSFDAILMDCRMPEVDGCACAKLIRQRGGVYSDIPIIAVTADIFDERPQRCLDAGMNDVLSKPFILSQMQEKLRRWLQVKI